MIYKLMHDGYTNQPFTFFDIAARFVLPDLTGLTVFVPAKPGSDLHAFTFRVLSQQPQPDCWWGTIFADMSYLPLSGQTLRRALGFKKCLSIRVRGLRCSTF